MHQKPLLRTALIVVAITLTLSSCTNAPAPVEEPEHVHVESDTPDFHGGKPRTEDVTAVWDAAAEKAAEEAANATMAAYVAHSGLTRDQWWEALSPHLDAIATRDYAWVDPSTIPATQITGPAEITPGATPALAQAAIPTDAGTYTLTLSRKDGAAPWQAGRIQPAGAAQ